MPAAMESEILGECEEENIVKGGIRRRRRRRSGCKSGGLGEREKKKEMQVWDRDRGGSSVRSSGRRSRRGRDRGGSSVRSSGRRSRRGRGREGEGGKDLEAVEGCVTACDATPQNVQGTTSTRQEREEERGTWREEGQDNRESHMGAKGAREIGSKGGGAGGGAAGGGGGGAGAGAGAGAGGGAGGAGAGVAGGRAGRRAQLLSSRVRGDDAVSSDAMSGEAVGRAKRFAALERDSEA
eukprot:767933-Hanusia_phi.AAC.1